MTWVHDQIFAAGGSHIPRTWSDFSDQTRVTAVLHMNPAAPQPFLGPPPQAFLWLAIEEEDQVDMQTRWLAGRFVQRQLRQGRSVLLHCRAGRHRTRWAYVSYLLLQGKGWQAALRQAEKPPWLAPYRSDREAWRQFAAWLEAEAPAEALRSA